jgi:hypothetical protein
MHTSAFKVLPKWTATEHAYVGFGCAQTDHCHQHQHCLQLRGKYAAIPWEKKIEKVTGLRPSLPVINASHTSVQAYFRGQISTQSNGLISAIASLPRQIHFYAEDCLHSDYTLTLLPMQCTRVELLRLGKKHSDKLDIGCTGIDRVRHCNLIERTQQQQRVFALKCPWPRTMKSGLSQQSSISERWV